MTDDEEDGDGDGDGEISAAAVHTHPAQVVALASEILNLSLADYLALRGRLAAMQMYLTDALLPEWTDKGEAAPE